MPDQFPGFVVTDFEVMGAGHWVESVEIVRQHSTLEQSLAEFRQHAGVVIHSFQYHALVQQRDACGFQAPERLLRVSIQFGRVIDMDDDDSLQA